MKQIELFPEINNNDFKNNETEIKKISPKDNIARIRKMKALAKELRHDNVSGLVMSDYIFYNQAKFMEDFTDNYRNKEMVANTYYIAYNYLNINQLRTYFTWRTNVRNHKIDETCKYYVMLYISELINLVGVKTIEEGWNTIISFWKEYRDLTKENVLDDFFYETLIQYVICYRMPYDYQTILSFMPDDVKEEKEKIEYNYEDKMYDIKILSKISCYEIENNNFYNSEYGYLMELVIPNVFKRLEEYFKKNNLDFGDVVIKIDDTENYCKLFDYRLSYYERRKNYNYDICINPYYHYICRDSTWYHIIHALNYRYDFVMVILRRIEEYLRKKVKFHKLHYVKKYDPKYLRYKRVEKDIKNVLINEEFNKTIFKAIDETLEQEEKNKLKKEQEELRKNFKVDVDNFDNIRESSKRVEEKLVIDKEIEEEDLSVPIQETEVEMGYIPFYHSLEDIEKEFIKMIINKEKYDAIKRKLIKNNILVEVMIENINMKALDYLGDNLLYEDNNIVIYEEYIDEIKNCINLTS